jgi:hypothetical protein
MAAKKVKKQDHKSVWEYADWLFLSGRLTGEEHLKLKTLCLAMEQDAVHRGNHGDCGSCDGCEQGYGCAYQNEGC